MKNEIVEPSDPRLTAYVVGEMTPDESAGFEVALENSPEAQEEIERIRDTADLLREEFGAELDAAFSSRDPVAAPRLTLVKDAHAAHQPPGFLPEMRTAIAALAAVLVATAVVAVSWMKHHNGDQTGPNVAMADSSAGTNGERGRENGPAVSAAPLAEIALMSESGAEVIDSPTSWSALSAEDAHLFPSYYQASAEADSLSAGTRRFLGDDPVQAQGRFLGEDGIEVQMMPVPSDPGFVIPAKSGAEKGPAFRISAAPSPYGYTIRGLDPNVANVVGYLEIAGHVYGDSRGEITRSLYLVGRSTDGNGNSSVRLKGQVHVEDGAVVPSNAGSAAAIGNGEVAGVANRYVTGLQERVNLANEAALRGTQFLIEKDYQGSISEMRAAMDLLPNAPVTRELKQSYADQFAVGSVKLAQQRAEEGDYHEALSLLASVLAPSVNPGNAAAKELLKQLDDHEYFGITPTPEPLQAFKAVELAQKRARGYAENGDFENAERKYWATLNENNYAARRSLGEVEEGVAIQGSSGGSVTVTGDTVNLVGGASINVSGAVNGGRIVMPSGSVESSQTVLGPESSTRRRVVLPGPGSEGALEDGSLIDFMDEDGDDLGPVDTLADKLDAGLSVSHAAAGLFQPDAEFELRWTDEELSAPSRTIIGRGKFAPTEDNPFADPMTTALSTFSVDVDTASYTEVRRMILEDGQLPDRDQVRIEEFINYFNYDSYETPDLATVEKNEQAPFSVSLECASAPWNPENRVVRIGLKGADFSAVDRPAANIDRLDEGRRVLVEGMNGSLVTIAKDVKIQVEFNAGKVVSYRLIGYTNRSLAREDFDDDTKDAGEIGAGHSVTALYEVVPVEAVMNLPQAEPVDDLKYKKRAGEEGAEAESHFERRQEAARKQQGLELVESPELLTVKLKYKRPNADESEPELQFPLVDGNREFAETSADFRFATAVGAFGEWLRFSSATANWNPGGKVQLTGNKLKVPISQGRSNRQLEKIARIAHHAIEGDEFGRKKEFVEMIKTAAVLNGGKKFKIEADAAGLDEPAGEDVGESVKEKLEQLR